MRRRKLWLKEKEDILELRRKLSSASDTIIMLILAAMGCVALFTYVCLREWNT